MNRRTLSILLVTIVAAFAFSSMAEAAPKKPVRHRTRHSSRVSSGAAATNTPSASNRKSVGTGQRKGSTGANATTTRKPGAKKPALTKRKPTTKPH
jgi:hypothetical protein